MSDNWERIEKLEIEVRKLNERVGKIEKLYKKKSKKNTLDVYFNKGDKRSKS